MENKTAALLLLLAMYAGVITLTVFFYNWNLVLLFVAWHFVQNLENSKIKKK